MIRFESVKASWKESFNFLKLDSIKLLALVSLNTLTFLYKAVLYAWFLPLGLFVGLLLESKYLIAAFYITFLVKAARPSMDQKKIPYWQQPFFADWLVFLGVFLFVHLPVLFSEVSLLSKLSSFVLKLFFLAGPTWLPGSELLGLILIMSSPFLVIWILFMLDAQRAFWPYLRSFVRAGKMFVFNYPFFLVMYAVFRLLLSAGYVLSLPLTQVIPQMPVIGWFILLGLIVPYGICFITCFYTKRLHEQFSLYYGK